jgi:hypothetical protein
VHILWDSLCKILSFAQATPLGTRPHSSSPTALLVGSLQSPPPLCQACGYGDDQAHATPAFLASELSPCAQSTPQFLANSFSRCAPLAIIARAVTICKFKNLSKISKSGRQGLFTFYSQAAFTSAEALTHARCQGNQHHCLHLSKQRNKGCGRRTSLFKHAAVTSTILFPSLSGTNYRHTSLPCWTGLVTRPTTGVTTGVRRYAIAGSVTRMQRACMSLCVCSLQCWQRFMCENVETTETQESQDVYRSRCERARAHTHTREHLWKYELEQTNQEGSATPSNVGSFASPFSAPLTTSPPP